MGRVTMNGPPPGEWCVACLMRAKQRQWEMYEEQIQAGWEASGEKRVIIPWPDVLTGELREGRYTAVAYEFVQLGLIAGLCWDDVAGIDPARVPSGLAVANGPLPPGLRKGKG